MSAKNKSSSSPGRSTAMPMATRRSSNADKAIDGTPASTDELMVRIGALERVLMSKMDTVVGELRAELVTTVQLLEGNFN